MGHGFIEWKNTPNYETLKSYEWIDDYLKAGEIQKEILFLREKKSEVRKVQASKRDMVARFKSCWETYEERRIAYLAKILRETNSGSRDPFSRLLHVTSWNPQWERVCTNVAWVDVKAAIDLIFSEQTGETLTDAEREKRLDELDQAIAELKIQLTESSPAGYFKLVRGEIAEDYRQTFITHWRHVQGQCREACGPHGIALSKSPPEEQDAHARLGISSAISKNIGAKSPLPESPFEERERSWGM
ncbi:hypothetical protein DSCO28_71960 [Desulfosarcina ovata subsp. sediminis]|uniref:Uncharacterized protein n=1 Tax=Desulfosarcina ovata subsp. sediminis TaxID=885957 RepID=A0A5K8A2V1_9BACT|nr:hypothetical protein [Desulfosarcina ovata]BBO86630.1 hypothetical protein DSCO28_71960 [Desulfosarcina ovata subsp. sediminis]